MKKDVLWLLAGAAAIGGLVYFVGARKGGESENPYGRYSYRKVMGSYGKKK